METHARSVPTRRGLTFALIGIALGLNAEGASLKPETLQAWHDYIEGVRSRNELRIRPGAPFLWTDESGGRRSALRGGRILAAPAEGRALRDVPSGLIHDWVGAAFLPGVTLSRAMAVLRDYDRYKDFYGPNVVDSRCLAPDGPGDRFSMLLISQSMFRKTALDSDYRVRYTPAGPGRMYSVSWTTRTQEVSGYGSNSQRLLPDGEGAGLIWRAYSSSRFEERDGGLYIEVEMIALSRDIPTALRMIVEPIVRRVARESVMTALRRTRDAVQNSDRDPGGVLLRSFR